MVPTTTIATRAIDIVILLTFLLEFSQKNRPSRIVEKLLVVGKGIS